MKETDKRKAGTSAIVGHLRRDLGRIESYAAIIGMMIGAGIFAVTSQAWALTGSSVILGYVVLTPITLATSVAYAAYLSTPLGSEPGGEYTHISRTFGGYRVAFVGAWLKIISYIGAEVFLSMALADYTIQFFGAKLRPETYRLPIAILSLAFFYVIHVIGVRWFGRLQVIMCALLGLSIIVLVVPGLFAVRLPNFTPFISHGVSGFVAALLPIFFSFAGFESLAQTAGEVKDSERTLPLIFLKGITVTAIIYVLMSVVAFGVLPGTHLLANNTPMSEVASVFLPSGAALFVTFGAIMAVTTSMNATMLVPSRLGLILAQDRLASQWVAVVNPRTGTPIRGLTLTFIACILLVMTDQRALALNIALLPLILLYMLHSLAFLLLPKLNPKLYSQVKISIPASLQRALALLSFLAMAFLVVMQINGDLKTITSHTLRQRLADHSLTSVELVLIWGLIGAALYALARRRAKREANTPVIDWNATEVGGETDAN